MAVLGASAAEPIAGRLVDFSGKGLRIETRAEVPCGSAIKVEGHEFLLLGEVCRLERGKHGFTIAVQVSHSLTALSELHRINRAILGEAPRVAEPVPR